MITSVSFNEFHDAFQPTRSENFSYAGLRLLYDYLEELEYDTGQPYEFDMISICCEWSEYDSIEEAAADYGEDIQTLEDLQERTTVLFDESNSVLLVESF